LPNVKGVPCGSAVPMLAVTTGGSKLLSRRRWVGVTWGESN
jgi:hypothetical protein